MQNSQWAYFNFGSVVFGFENGAPPILINFVPSLQTDCFGCSPHHNKMYSMKLFILVLGLIALLQAQTSLPNSCAVNSSLPLLAAGSITLNPLDSYNNASNKEYYQDLSNARFQQIDVLSYAFAISGLQFDCGQPFYSLGVDVVQFLNQNTRMRIMVNFRNDNNYLTRWTKCIFTYLVVSRNFNGAYSNIWASVAEVKLNNTITNREIDNIGLIFAQPPNSKNCDVYNDPYLTLDIAGCEAVTVSGQHSGGLPIIHAYIMGFRWNSNISTNHLLSAGVLSGAVVPPVYDDSKWQITYQNISPNGPKVTINNFGGALQWVKVAFVYSRMDFFNPTYPQNSQLTYSSSYIFEKLNKFNTIVPTSNKSPQSSSHFYALRDIRYAIYGFSSFSFMKSNLTCQQITIKATLNDINTFTMQSSIYQPDILFSADIFTYNVDKICVQTNLLNPLSNDINIITQKNYFTIPTQSQYQYIIEDAFYGPTLGLTSSNNAIYLLFSSKQTGDSDNIFYKAELNYNGFIPNSPVRLEFRFFQVGSMMIPGSTYSILIKADDVNIYQIFYQALPAGVPNISPTIYRGFNTKSSSIKVSIIITFTRSLTVPTQSLEMLLAIFSYSKAYDPVSGCCLPGCPDQTGLDVSINPPACIHCQKQKGLVYNPSNGTCTCLSGYYLDQSKISQCYPCAALYCSICNPTNPSICTSCVIGAYLSLVTQTCTCGSGYFVNGTLCAQCPHQCQTCNSPFGACSSCVDPQHRDLSLNCKCLNGYYDNFKANCTKCNPTCLTCSSSDNCISCDLSKNRMLVGSLCMCFSGYFQFYIDSVNKICTKCSPQCLTCEISPFSCLTCDAKQNRVMGLDNYGHMACICLPGYYSTSDGNCIQSNCNADPFCSQCEQGLQLCVQCLSTKKRILKLPQSICACMDGFYEDSNKNCIPCQPGCSICQNNRTCNMCVSLAKDNNNGSCSCPLQTYFAISPDSIRFCASCGLYCQVCSNLTYCLTCSLNFTKSIDGSCICPQGRFLDKNGLCLPCATGCKICSSVSNCTLCLQPLVLQNITCRTSCKDSYTLSGSSCIPCSQGCLKCTSNLICFYCVDGFYSYKGSCYDICPQGTIGDSLSTTWVCRPCNSPCKTCINHPSLCTSCEMGQGYLQISTYGQTCVQKCGDGTYENEGVCKICDLKCAACLGSASNCLSCSSGMILYKGGCWVSCPGITITDSKTCSQNCPAGYYKVSASECAPCSLKCITCQGSPSNCTLCLQGYVQINGTCSNKCNQNQFNFKGICLACSKSCKGCQFSPNDCLACADGYIKSGSICQQQCSILQYYDNTKNQCFPCHHSCASCEGPNSNQCSNCANGNLPVRGVCSSCMYPCQKCQKNGSCISCLSGFFYFMANCYVACPQKSTTLNSVCVCTSGLSFEGQCVDKCDGGYTNINGICRSCDNNCLQCKDAPNKCTKCQGGWSLDAQKQKCTSSSFCPYGQQILGQAGCQPICGFNFNYMEGICTYGGCVAGYTPNGFGGCVKSSNKGMRMCPNGQFILNGKCLQNCGIGYFGDNSLGFCSPCPNNCLQCTNPVSCMTCKQGFTPSQGQCILTTKNRCSAGTYSYKKGCVLACPAGTYMNESQCARFCPEGTFYYNNICFQGCPTTWRTTEACMQSCPLGTIGTNHVCE